MRWLLGRAQSLPPISGAVIPARQRSHRGGQCLLPRAGRRQCQLVGSKRMHSFIVLLGPKVSKIRWIRPGLDFTVRPVSVDFRIPNYTTDLLLFRTLVVVAAGT
jgi:hypothetical protein